MTRKEKALAELKQEAEEVTLRRIKMLLKNKEVTEEQLDSINKQLEELYSSQS